MNDASCQLNLFVAGKTRTIGIHIQRASTLAELARAKSSESRLAAIVNDYAGTTCIMDLQRRCALDSLSPKEKITQKLISDHHASHVHCICNENVPYTVWQ